MVSPTVAQSQIRDHEKLDLLVVAPAGCGKTEALALRVAGLIDRGTVAPPRRILVTTFSNRARDNIRDRLSNHVTAATMRDRVTISNFHGLSTRIFRAHATVIGLNPSMLIPESDWVGEECRRRRLSFPRMNAVQEILRAAKQVAADDARVDQILSASGDNEAVEIERLRRSENRLTYDDLPRLAELILAHDDVARLYSNHFAAVIVDEFQDLTPQQLRIVNRIGWGKTTYAGDLAQGIYRFAGAKPEEVDTLVRHECSEIVEFAESHRSSPAVLSMVNSLTTLTGGQPLTCADPTSWPHGGLGGRVTFESTDHEVVWLIGFTRFILAEAPNQRVGVISRTASRRRFVDAAFSESDLPAHRWDDGVLDTDTARVVRAMLARLDTAEFRDAADPLIYLRESANIEGVQDPSTRDSLGAALNWCCDLLVEGLTPDTIRSRVRVGDANTLLDLPGVHLLTGHVGKGQQFDWVVVIGAEDGCIPDFRAKTSESLSEEARILSVMISRARHGAVITHAERVPAASTGAVYPKEPSRYWQAFDAAGCHDSDGIVAWVKSASWNQIAAR